MIKHSLALALEEIRRHSDGYAHILQQLYLSGTNCLKQQRTRKLIDYLAKKAGIGDKSVLDVGCGPGFILLEFAKNLGYECFGVDFSEKEIRIARDNLWIPYINRLIGECQVSFYTDDIFAPSQGWSRRKYDLVTCIDVLGSYERDQKEEVISALVPYVDETGRLLITTLCCEKEETAEQYKRGEAIRYREKGREVPVVLHNETLDTYVQIMSKSLDGNGRKFDLKRLDPESILIDVHQDFFDIR